MAGGKVFRPWIKVLFRGLISMVYTVKASERRRGALAKRVEKIVANTPVFDIHTHLYDPAFQELLLWGIDDLLTYHYLVAEGFRQLDLPAEKFWSLTRTRRADLIWDALFVQHSPISEACRGVLTTLNLLGLDVKKRDLPSLRRWFAGQKLEKHLARCLELGRVERICMTNSPFDDLERPVWDKGFRRDQRFVAALRIDPLLLDWPRAAGRLANWGYDVGPNLSAAVAREVRRFLADWSRRMDAKYLMVSLPSDFDFPLANTCCELIEKAILPHCREFGLPFALMPGVKSAANPQLRLAGDGWGRLLLRPESSGGAAKPLRRFSGEQVSGNGPVPGKPARTLRAGSEIPESAHLRLLVVHQRAVGRRRDDAHAP